MRALARLSQQFEARGGRAVVIGGRGGLGWHFTDQLLQRSSVTKVVATTRDQTKAANLSGLQEKYGSKLSIVELNPTDESSLRDAAHNVGSELGGVDLLIQASGILHEGDALRPEASLDKVDPGAFMRSVEVNALAPLLVLKHFRQALERSGEEAISSRRGLPVAAFLSARLGSIGDNRSGGWYSYRSSKAALNQAVRCASFELMRRKGKAIAVALHPGTNDTPLTQPFQVRLHSFLFFFFPLLSSVACGVR